VVLKKMREDDIE
jgi:calmodulin